MNLDEVRHRLRASEEEERVVSLSPIVGKRSLAQVSPPGTRLKPTDASSLAPSRGLFLSLPPPLYLSAPSLSAPRPSCSRQIHAVTHHTHHAFRHPVQIGANYTLKGLREEQRLEEQRLKSREGSVGELTPSKPGTPSSSRALQSPNASRRGSWASSGELNLGKSGTSTVDELLAALSHTPQAKRRAAERSHSIVDEIFFTPGPKLAEQERDGTLAKHPGHMLAIVEVAKMLHGTDQADQSMVSGPQDDPPGMEQQPHEGTTTRGWHAARHFNRMLALADQSGKFNMIGEDREGEEEEGGEGEEGDDGDPAQHHGAHEVLHNLLFHDDADAHMKTELKQHIAAVRKQRRRLREEEQQGDGTGRRSWRGRKDDGKSGKSKRPKDDGLSLMAMLAIATAQADGGAVEEKIQRKFKRGSPRAGSPSRGASARARGRSSPRKRKIKAVGRFMSRLTQPTGAVRDPSRHVTNGIDEGTGAEATASTAAEARAGAGAGAGAQAGGVDALDGEEAIITDSHPEHKITEARAKKGLLPRTGAMFDQAIADLEAPKVMVADESKGRRGGKGGDGSGKAVGGRRGGEGGEPEDGEGPVDRTGGSDAASDGDAAAESRDGEISTTITVTHTPKAPPNRKRVADPTAHGATSVDALAMSAAVGANMTSDAEATSATGGAMKLRARPNALDLALTESVNRPSVPGPTIDGGGGVAAAGAAAAAEAAGAAGPVASADPGVLSPLTPSTFIVVTRTPRMSQESVRSESTDGSVDGRVDALVESSKERGRLADDLAARSGVEGETDGDNGKVEGISKAEDDGGLKSETERVSGGKRHGGERRAKIETAEEEARTKEKERRDLDTEAEAVLESERDELRTFLTEDTVRHLLSQADDPAEALDGHRAERVERFSGNAERVERFSGNAERSRAYSAVSELTMDSAVRATTPNTHFTFVLPSPKAAGGAGLDAAIHEKTDGEWVRAPNLRPNLNCNLSPILSPNPRPNFSLTKPPQPNPDPI